MRRRLVMGLFGLCFIAVLVAMVPATAEAGCKNLPPRMCAAWITGTVFCDNLINGVSNKIAKDCNPEQPETCPLITECTIFGTFGSDPACTNPLVFPDPDADCEILGNLTCSNPNGFRNDEGASFVPGPISEASGFTTCTKGGKCVNEAEVQPENDGLCPGPSQTGGSGNWTLDFTPSEFKGQVCICPGGFDDSGVCCAGADRTGSGACKKIYGDGTPGCITEFCTIAPNAPKGTEYTCKEIE